MLRPERTLAAFLIAAFSSTAVLSPALAADADPTHRLRDVESELSKGAKHQAEVDKEIEALAADIAKLRKQTISAAAGVQSHEDDLSAIETRLTKLDAQAAKVRARLERRSDQHEVMLTAMVRFARNPPEAALLLPAAPIDTIRGAAVMRAALGPLEAGIKRDAGDLARLTAIRDKIAKEEDDKRAETVNLKSESTRLDGLLRRMVALQKKAKADSADTAQRVAKLSREAKNLKDLLGRLQTQPAEKPPAPKETKRLAMLKPPAPVKPFSAARGSLAMPARGKIVRSFGQPTGVGLASKGITLATRPAARVVAPYDGKVVFAGPFRGYGQLLIISQGEGYHILLSGLSRIDCAVGQWLLAGEPVGVMGPGNGDDPQLYIELRHDGDPINPLPWIAFHEEKVKG